MAKSFYRDIQNLKPKQYKYWTHVTGCAKENFLDYLINYEIDSDDDSEETSDKTSNETDEETIDETDEEIGGETGNETDEKTSSETDEETGDENESFEFNSREIKENISNVFLYYFVDFMSNFNALFIITLLYISSKINAQFRLVR